MSNGTRCSVARVCSRTARGARGRLSSLSFGCCWTCCARRSPLCRPMRFARLHSDCTLRGGSLRVPTLIYRHNYGSCSAVTLALSTVWSLCSSIANRWSRSGCAPTIWLRGELFTCLIAFRAWQPSQKHAGALTRNTRHLGYNQTTGSRRAYERRRDASLSKLEPQSETATMYLPKTNIETKKL